MSKAKTFMAGVLLGCFLVTGVAFASDEAEILTFIDAKFRLNGQEIAAPAAVAAPAEKHEDSTLVEINGEMYWSIEHAANTLGLDWKWNHDLATLELATRQKTDFSAIAPDAVPDSLRGWIEQSQTKELAQSRLMNGDTYMLITRGEKSTGGYKVSVGSVERVDHKLIVRVTYTNPDKGDIVTQGFTYPYALIKVRGEYDDIKYVLDDGKPIPEIEGMNDIPSLVAETDDLMVFSTAMKDGVLHVEGAVNSFGGTVWIKWLDGDVVKREYTVGGAAAAPDWGTFAADIELGEQPQRGTLRIYAMSPDGEDWREIQLGYAQLAHTK